MTTLWFKRKRSGLGWFPITWQGWTVIAVYVILLLVISFSFDKGSSPSETVLTFVLPLILLTAALIAICYKKGEKLF
jgi:hypothetical protein